MGVRRIVSTPDSQERENDTDRVHVGRVSLLLMSCTHTDLVRRHYYWRVDGDKEFFSGVEDNVDAYPYVIIRLASRHREGVGERVP